jgi:hypothetical protein
MIQPIKKIEVVDRLQDSKQAKTRSINEPDRNVMYRNAGLPKVCCNVFLFNLVNELSSR